MVTVRQDDGSYEVVIQAGKSFNISDHLDLMNSLKNVVHKHLGNFSVRKFDKVIEPKDFKHQNVIESQAFSRPFGTIKTSYVKAPNKTKLIVKHSKRVDEEKRGSRSRHIHKIFIENKRGEKFAFPYPYVTGAKAMTRHVSEGGTPYDNRGKTILQMCEDLLVMKKMLKGAKKGKLINEENSDTIKYIKEAITSIQRGLRNSISRGGYNNVQENILERYLDNDGRHVYNTTSETNLEEDEHSLWSKGVEFAKRLNPFGNKDDSNKLKYNKELDFPLHIDPDDPEFAVKHDLWFDYELGPRELGPYRDRLDQHRQRTIDKFKRRGIEMGIAREMIIKAADDARLKREQERQIRYNSLGEDMNNTEDTPREHFQTRLVSAMLELFKDRANLKMEIDPNDPEHPNNENPEKYASAMGEVAKLSSLLSFLAMRTKNDIAFGVLTELSERIHDMDHEAIVMVHKMANAMDKVAQSTSTKTEESTMVSIEESIINTLTAVLR
jgi:hypothetical protein